MPSLDWIGKNKVINHHIEAPYYTLENKYSYGDSAQSGNMIIHGDNLLALKSLLPRYEGQVDCIYIDPPYNTGNEKWVYNDNVNDPRIKKWLGEVVGTESEDLSRHDKWLCMMYPRLKLLHKLLSENGVIFISIEDNEQSNLKQICDEIFGNNNFIAQILVKRQGGRQDSKHYAVVHEYCLCYAKKAISFIAGKQVKEDSVYPKYDEVLKKHYKTQLLRKWGSNSLRENRPNLYYPISAPDGTEVYPTIYQGKSGDPQFLEIEGRWRWSASNMASAIAEHRVEFIKDNAGHWIPYEKIFAPDDGEIETKKFTTWQEETGNGTNQLKQIFGKAIFDYPKSVDLLELVLKMANVKKNAIILDSFAGSGTTAHAVLNLNKQDGGNRKFILVEMMDYAESITAERVKRVIDGYGAGDKATEGTGGGFSYYELGVPLLIDNHINENADAEKIREYIYFTETKRQAENKADEKYLLGVCADTAYYFYYEKRAVTTLNREFLHTVKTKASGYVIYADLCTLSDSELEKYHIAFKKIPRDVTKF